VRGKSHHCLGRYLANHYMNTVPKRFVTAFLIGCTEPDRNPATYLKGSIRCQWLRGHNYHNARRFMRRISVRLETKETWNLWDYYTLGKLIHYTADAFTSAHNDRFPKELADHREYENQLQEHFLRFMAQDPKVDVDAARDVMTIVARFHRDYEQQAPGLHIDSQFALTVSCCIVAMLLTKPIL